MRKASGGQDNIGRNAILNTCKMEITKFSVFRVIRFCNGLLRRGRGTKAKYIQRRAQ